MEIRVKSIQQATILLSIDGHTVTAYHDGRNASVKVEPSDLAPFATAEKIMILRHVDEVVREGLADNKQGISKHL